MHTHSVSDYSGGFLNPCGEVVVGPGQTCNISQLRPHGEPIGFMPDDWTALDDILYALKEDELAEKIGRRKAKKIVAKEIAERKLNAFQKKAGSFFDFMNNHTHSMPGPRPSGHTFTALK